MQEGEDLARFIEEQRAKLAHDRNILKNNPASAITDNSTNRQYLRNKDKENRVPRDADVVPDLPNGFPPPAPQNAGRPPSTPRIFRLGDDYRRKKEKLQEELREDYRNAMAEKNLRTTGVRHEGVPVGPRQNSDLGLSLPIRDHLSAKERLRLERNKEYNRFLHRKDEVEKEKRAARSRSVSISPVRGVPAATPVKDAATETYEDLLERKRRQEKSYRAANEGQRDFRERTRMLEDENDEDDDGYYSQRRVRFPSKGRRARRDRRYYEDEIDFDEDDDIPRRRYSRRGRGRRRRRILSSDDEEDSEEDDRPLRRRRDVSTEKKKLTSSFEREATTGSLYTSKEKEVSDDLRSKSAPPEQPFTGLPIGSNASANTVQRRKEEYRLQLLQQMEEKKQSKKKEREQDLQLDVASINANERETKTNRRNEKPDVSPSKRQAVNSPPPEEHRKKKEKKSSVRYRLESSSSEEDAPRRRLNAPHPRRGYYPPPGQPAMGYYPPQYPSPYDEAYYYYGSRNPLDPPGLMPQPPVMFPAGVSPLMAAAGQQQGEPDTIEDSRATDINASGRRSFNKNESSLVADEKRDEGKKKQQMIQYQEELKHQIALKQREKKEARDEQERYNMKMEAEARNYNPWGKGGGGAPMKDRKGNLISDLRQMHLENEEMVRDPTKAEEVVRERLPQTNLYRREDRPVIDLSPRQGADDDPDALSPRFGRSNPFESKQSDEQKAQRDQYKDYLQKQIEEKRRIEAEQRERERIEDEKEERRLEEQRKHIQAELEAEQEKERSKKEKARLQNEQLRMEAEERKRTEQRRKMEDEAEIRKQKDEELNKKLHATAPSPPVPALREQVPAQPSARVQEPPPEPELRSSRHDTMFLQQVQQPQPSHTPHIQTYRANSPGRQTDRDKVRSRAESKRVSRELSALRKQLLSEQRRVENQLRTVDMTGQAPRAKTEYLVDLSKSRQKPVSVRRPPTVEKDRPSSKALKEFNDYKHRPDDTASIRMFRAEYPETPSDAKALERQQEALLARQGRNLEQLRQGKHPDQPSPDRRRRDQDRYRYRPPPTAQSQASLQAETSYIPVLPGDEDDDLEARFRIDSNQSSPPPSRESRRPSARERRRMAHKPPSAQSERGVAPRARQDNYSLNSLSSLATLDVDRLANKNHNRLEKLRAIQGDEVSLTDPDDILDRFVNKQKGRDGRRGRRPTTNEDGFGGRAGPSDPIDFPIQSFNTRPPSVNTVDTEPWLRPETGPTVA